MFMKLINRLSLNKLYRKHTDDKDGYRDHHHAPNKSRGYPARDGSRLLYFMRVTIALMTSFVRKNGNESKYGFE